MRLLLVAYAMFFAFGKQPENCTAHTANPNPMVQPYSNCGNSAASAICDPQLILSRKAANFSSVLARSLKNSTKCQCGDAGLRGYELGVLLVESMEDYLLDAKQASERAFNAWGIGHRGCNNGVLLFLSKNDRQIYIKTGKGAKEVLTDTKLLSIIGSMKNRLRSGDYDHAILHAIANIGLVLGMERAHLEHKLSEQGFDPSFSIEQGDEQGAKPVLTMEVWMEDHFCTILASSIFAYLLLVWCSKPKPFDDCKRRLRQIETEEADAALLAKKFKQKECLICLDPLPSSSKGRKLLSCGHTFCAPCIVGWMQKKQECPLCRKNVCTDSVACSTSSLLRRMRLRSLQQQYPMWIEDSMIDDWTAGARAPSDASSDASHQPAINMLGHPRFLQHEEDVRQKEAEEAAQ
jgi:hypothetical protein